MSCVGVSNCGLLAAMLYLERDDVGLYLPD